MENMQIVFVLYAFTCISKCIFINSLAEAKAIGFCMNNINKLATAIGYEYNPDSSMLDSTITACLTHHHQSISSTISAPTTPTSSAIPIAVVSITKSLMIIPYFIVNIRDKMHMKIISIRDTMLSNEKFGTTLASIHSESDMMQARTVCKQLTSSNGCWIGLKDIGNRIYEWFDGTVFDYGTTLHEYPWYISEPGVTSDQPCTFLDPSNGADSGEYLWDDYWCHLRRLRAICNAPSEICNHKEFNIIRGSVSNWSFNGCKPMIKTSLEAESITLLSCKQYFNSLGILAIDMMYSITSIGLYGNAGIALYFDKNNNYYYAGIWGGHIGYNLNTFYTLSITLIHETEWNIYLNEKLLLTGSDNEFDKKYKKLSGYIAIRNINAAINVKSLYISGDVKYENDNNIWYTQCTDTPTNAPTINTIPPTTQIPSKNPTNNYLWFILLYYTISYVNTTIYQCQCIFVLIFSVFMMNKKVTCCNILSENYYCINVNTFYALLQVKMNQIEQKYNKFKNMLFLHFMMGFNVLLLMFWPDFVILNYLAIEWLSIIIMKSIAFVFVFTYFVGIVHDPNHLYRRYFFTVSFNNCACINY